MCPTLIVTGGQDKIQAGGPGGHHTAVVTRHSLFQNYSQSVLMNFCPSDLPWYIWNLIYAGSSYIEGSQHGWKLTCHTGSRQNHRNIRRILSSLLFTDINEHFYLYFNGGKAWWGCSTSTSRKKCMHTCGQTWKSHSNNTSPTLFSFFSLQCRMQLRAK